MAKFTIRCNEASGSHFKANVPDIFLEFERRGINLREPFTVEVDTMLGLIEVEQPTDSQG